MIKTTLKFHFWSDSIIKRVKFLLKKFVELASRYITKKNSRHDYYVLTISYKASNSTHSYK